MLQVNRRLISIFNYLFNCLQIKGYRINIGNKWNINGIFFVQNDGKIVIGTNFKAYSTKYAGSIGGDSILRFVVRKDAELIIGNNVGISNTSLVCWNKIEIGDYVYIGGGCKIWDTDFHSIDPIERRRNNDTKVKTSPIKIEDYAFIGGSSIILKGVIIGENSIVAAGSVVTKSIPKNEIWGGNPAKFIKTIY